MKAVVSQAELVSIVGKIQSVLASKPSVPILASLLVEAIDDQLIVSATDLAVSMRCYTGATVLEEGAIALPGKKFFHLIRELTTPQIKISASTNEIAEIAAGSSVFKIHGMNRAEFPDLPDLSGSPEFRLSASSLKEMLSKTIFAASREESRYTLNGVQLSIANQKAVLIGTDGKKLAKASTSIAIDPSIHAQFVIPLKAVEEMVKILTESSELVTISFSPDKLSLQTGSQTLIAKLLSGQFPDVERVIPLTLAQQCCIHREELMILLRQVSLFTSANNGSVRFSFEMGQLHLTAMSQEIGEGRVSMPVDFSGPLFEIAFNPHYLLDILRHCKDETIRFGLNDSHNPGLITDSSQAIFVIMPMRLADAALASKEVEVVIE